MGDYVTIYNAPNEAMAGLIEQRLVDAGIPCVVASGGIAAVAGPTAPYSVTVPAERADEARALLDV
jgi:Putative prokaryotic signal transducing protein